MKYSLIKTIITSIVLLGVILVAPVGVFAQVYSPYYYNQPIQPYQNYSYPYNQYQSYNYNYPYNNYYNNLSVNCYATPTSAGIGQTVNWQATVSGGSGSYGYSWTGTDGLTAFNSSSVAASYSTAGSKSASITVTSGGQSITEQCGTVYINTYTNYPYIYNQNYNSYPYNYNYQTQPVYQYNNQYSNQYVYPNQPLTTQYYYPQNTNTYTPMVVTCSANETFVPAGATVTWTAYASGGAGYFYYTWSGTDNPIGDSQTMSTIYWTGGVKTASVTVRSSDNQFLTVPCTNSVTVGVPLVYSQY